MNHPDLNLLVALDTLLAEGSVARAARRLHLSPSAMSRTLARLREATGDPLLVRAGRGVVPSPRALALREQVRRVVHDAEAVLRPVDVVDLARLTRTYTLRTSEGFVETFGPALIARTRHDAPRVTLRFVQKPDKDSTALREGTADLETGVVGTRSGPEIRAQALFRDRVVGVVRAGHPLAQEEVPPARFAAAQHVRVFRQGAEVEQVDEALESLGLAREVAVVVDGFAKAIAIARASDLVACVPERHTAGLRMGLHAFALPVPVTEITVSLLWHPRMEADPAHRWLRDCVRDVCAAVPTCT